MSCMVICYTEHRRIVHEFNDIQVARHYIASKLEELGVTIESISIQTHRFQKEEKKND